MGIRGLCLDHPHRRRQTGIKYGAGALQVTDLGSRQRDGRPSSHVECFHPCFPKKAELELIKIGIGHRKHESGRWIGGQGDMRRFGFNVANCHVIRIPGPDPFRGVKSFFKVIAASVKIYGASASLIIHVFKAVFAHTE